MLYNRSLAILTFALIPLACGKKNDNKVPIASANYLDEPANLLACVPQGEKSTCKIKSQQLGLVSTPLVSPSLLRFTYTFLCPNKEGLAPIVIKTDAQERRLVFNKTEQSISLFGWKGSQVEVSFTENMTHMEAGKGGCLLKLKKTHTQKTQQPE